MALPTSGPISMSMVATEFSSSQTTNMSLFGLASELSTPVTTNIELAADFYGESAVTLTSFTAVTNGNSGYSTQGDACSAAGEEPTLTIVYGTSVSNGFPAANSYVYENNNTSDPLPANYYAVPGSGKKAPNTFQITGTSGQLNGGLTECS